MAAHVRPAAAAAKCVVQKALEASSPALKALHGPFGAVRFCPTGGISAATAPAYLALPNVACVGGGWVAPADAIAAGDWRRITDLARAARGLAH